MSIEQQIATTVLQAVTALYGEQVAPSMVQLQKTKKEFEGNLTLVVFPFVKMARRKPEEVGEQIGAYLKEHCEAVANYNVVKGFLNLEISPKAWLNLLDRKSTRLNSSH